MNGQKQSRLDNLEKRMAAATNVIQQIINELSHLKDLSIGTLETVKNIEGYEQAIEKLKEKVVPTHREHYKCAATTLKIRNLAHSSKFSNRNLYSRVEKYKCDKFWTSTWRSALILMRV